MPPVLKIAAVLTISAVASLCSLAHAAETASPNDVARFLAGLQPSPGSPLESLTEERAWQQHAALMNSTWAGLEEHQLSKIRTWSRTNLTARRPVTYYLFSGPDFLYADAFFPGSSTYILAGLEHTGQLPDVLRLRRRSLAAELANLRTSLGTLLSRSYFITSEMGTDLSASELRGTLPLLYVFLARTGKTIRDVSFVNLAPDGNELPGDAKSGARGVKIVFSGNGGRTQALYYFKTDLSNRGVQNSGFLQFCAQFGAGDIFIKAASYLLHTAGFSRVRTFLLEQAATIVQDDTGIPVTYLQQAGWRLQPFGRYVGPIPMFRGHYQSKLKELFAKGDAAPIDFGIGYRWRTNQSHVLLAVNTNAASANAASTKPPGPSAISARKASAKGVPPTPAAARDGPFADWRSVLLGGLVTNALVNLLGLQGLANALGFLLQTAAIGTAAWLASSYVRNRRDSLLELTPEHERTAR